MNIYKNEQGRKVNPYSQSNMLLMGKPFILETSDKKTAISLCKAYTAAASKLKLPPPETRIFLGINLKDETNQSYFVKITPTIKEG